MTTFTPGAKALRNKRIADPEKQREILAWDPSTPWSLKKDKLIELRRLVESLKHG